MTVDLKALGTDFATPMFIVQGEEDLTDPPALAKAYFDVFTPHASSFTSIAGLQHGALLRYRDAEEGGRGGWLEWGDRLKTSTYREYRSYGPGMNGGSRSVAYAPLSAEEERGFPPASLLAGDDKWNPMAEVQRLRSLH